MMMFQLGMVGPRRARLIARLDEQGRRLHVPGLPSTTFPLYSLPVGPLDQVAEQLGEYPQLTALAEYCRQRERGLRRDAFKALHKFIHATETWLAADARWACHKILEIHAQSPEAHQLLSHPLLTRFIFPVLDAWLTDDPTSHPSLRWLGILRRDRSLLERAVARSPDDVLARRHLAGRFLSDVEFATHHLAESRLLADLDATRVALAEARSVAEGAPDRHLLQDIFAEIEEYEALLRDWESYSSAPHGTFPEWCNRRGRAATV